MQHNPVEFAMRVQSLLIEGMSGPEKFVSPLHMGWEHTDDGRVNLFMGYDLFEDATSAVHLLKESGFIAFQLAAPRDGSPADEREKSEGAFYGGRLVVLS